MESAALAAQVIKFRGEGVQPQNSYRLMVEVDNETGTERLVWLGRSDGKEIRYHSEPEVGLWRRFGAWLIGLLLIEKHL